MDNYEKFDEIVNMQCHAISKMTVPQDWTDGVPTLVNIKVPEKVLNMIKESYEMFREINNGDHNLNSLADFESWFFTSLIFTAIVKGSEDFEYFMNETKRKIKKENEKLKYGLSYLLKNIKMSPEEILESALEKGTYPAVCTECGYICEMEPDQDIGYCDQCHTNNVKSMLVLTGTI